ncbi:MAG TPA: cytochrome c3 family protein [Anaerolineae bacterium]|nr:cytochrome c3 family protein [Anaerolineae bacterium]
MLNSAFGLHLETTKPVNVCIEYIKVDDPAVINNPQIESVSALRDRCPELRSGKELTIEVCYQCHSPEDLGLTHPVGVVLKGTMKTPNDLPVLKGNIITCVTCHNVHGANRPYLARQEMTHDVCVSCHDEY